MKADKTKYHLSELKRIATTIGQPKVAHDRAPTPEEQYYLDNPTPLNETYRPAPRSKGY